LDPQNNENLKKKDGKCHTCELCNNVYNSRTTLWRHKKNCVLEKKAEESENKKAPIIPNITNNITKNNQKTINTINVNLFLNGHCKNALLNDFVDRINLSLKDMDWTIKNGYIEDISSILTKSLEAVISPEPSIEEKFDNAINEKLAKLALFKEAMRIKSGT